MPETPLQYRAIETQKPVVGKQWSTMGEVHAREVDAWLSTFQPPLEIISHQHTETSFVADGDMPYLRIVDVFVYRA